MALDLTGIDNRGEFYSHHYLDALLEGDLASILQRWNEGEKATPPVRSPVRVLGGLANRYFQARAQAADIGAHAPELSWRTAHAFHAELLSALGYPRKSAAVLLEDGTTLPLLHEERRGGRAALWVIETGFAPEGEDPLDQVPLRAQYDGAADDVKLPERSWRELLDKGIFAGDDAPTWVLALCGHEVVLTHRHKWSRGKALAFDLDELFARRQPAAFRAMAGLLHKDALCPTDGSSLHETLDESSHKHAFAVSTDLRQSAQQAIEILGNEAIHYLRTQRKKGVFGSSETAEGIDARELTRECLVWLYRLIFLLYVESRSDELGVAPMKSEAYRRGYSFESLRALETVPLTTPQAQEGTYLHESLKKLFLLVNDGHPKDQQLALAMGVDTVAFRLHGLRSRLFDDRETPILAKVKFRNQALQRVIELLSLSREGQRKERGRISYASLGINQLGAVYEGLLSYTGFFAETDLIEVANAGENGKPDARTFFVPESQLELYDEKELVKDETGARVRHPKGTFLFRLAGRDREKSASYYTPEVLTRCLVKYTLRERIGVSPTDPNWVKADDLLKLTVCEPAMGSGAFLNEVVNQLAEAYLQRKQAETGQTIAADAYGHHLQRVKARIAARQCYGVDLNPLAAELGKVSLWLNVLRAGAPSPFFDARIAVGNSLVGARRAVYRTETLRKGTKAKGPGWLDLAPEEVKGERPADAVWHFLLPAAGMAAFDGDKVVAGLVPEKVALIKAWRKGLNANWSKEEQSRLLKLSEVVDRLWREHSKARREALKACDLPLAVWPEEEGTASGRDDEERLTEIWRQHLKEDVAGQRLKNVLDRWCSYWFWPVTEAERLPSRAEWLEDLEAMLTGPLFVDPGATDAAAGRARVAMAVAGRQRFFHWEWAFPEVLEEGGFDVVVGNPPWVKLQWDESGILSDLDPRLEIRRMSAKKVADERATTLAGQDELEAYLREFEGLEGQQAFLNDGSTYPLLQGVQTNLYKVFFVQALQLARSGVSAYFHQKGVFDDPKGGPLRAHLAPRLRWHLHFINKLMLFEGIEDQKHYEVSVLGPPQDKVAFRLASNLFHPRTLDESLAHDGLGEVPVIKGEDGVWDLRGHRSRIVEVDESTLALFAKLYDEPGTPAREARLPVVHSAEILSALRRFANAPTLAALKTPWEAIYDHLDQSRQQADGTIAVYNDYPSRIEDLIISGPHFYVATPLNKTPNENCRHNQDYSGIDLGTTPPDYLPRSSFKRACSREEWVSRLPVWLGRPFTNRFRHVHREMIAPTGERTLIPAMIAPGVTHIHTVMSVAFEHDEETVAFSGMCASIPVDFFVKSTGAGHANRALIATLPFPTPLWSTAIIRRTLRLNCLTTHYADLWRELYTPAFATDTHTKPDPRLPAWTHLTAEWTWDTPLRTPFARRQALVELDALAALSLGLTADELCLIYRVQFPVLQQYEADTWYDRRGRIVFTNNRGLVGVGLDRAQWNAIKGEALSPLVHAGVTPLPDWARDALGPYEPPFDRCDREADMRQAYAEFQRRLGGEAQ